MKLQSEVLNYIIHFLVNDEAFEEYECIQYGEREDVEEGIVIEQSHFFDEDVYGTPQSIPQRPFSYINDIPVLWGDGWIEVVSRRFIIIHADLIASTYFMITRYEEMVKREMRDEHGRFLNAYSVIGTEGYTTLPLVDYWGKILREQLRFIGKTVREPKAEYHSISLTHDIDTPWHKFNLFQAVKRVGSILKHQRKLRSWPIGSWRGKPKKDPLNVFENMIQSDQKIKNMYCNCRDIYFVVSGRKELMKSTFDYLHTKYFKTLTEMLEQNHSLLGWHISYEAGDDPKLMKSEIEELRNVLGRDVSMSRNHYLRSCEPEDFQYLIDLGITDDYTMGYADYAGFRLGTSRCVRWINPMKCQLTNLLLHPLQIMDCTFTDYMKVDEEYAIEACRNIIAETKKNGGDLTLLWHNTVLSEDNKEYTNQLYSKCLEMLECE